MYAVIQTGGKQHRVAEGETLEVEKLDVKEGASVTFDQVLLVKKGDDVKVGSPLVDGAKVTAKVVAQGRGDKIQVFKYKRRKNYTRRLGHRQPFTRIEITKIAS